jgi:Tfp pilus assembly protein PilX
MSRLQRSSLHTRLFARRLSDESGIALILALSVMLVLTVLVTSALAFTSSNSRDASRGTAAQKSYAAAEAGINNALAAVQLAGSDTTKMSAQPTSATSGGTVTTLPSGCTSNCITVRWGGSYNAASQTWTLKAISNVPNPTGSGAAALTRTLTQTATITPPPYSFVALNTSCDNHTLLVETGGNLTVTNAMYIDSCNSPQDAFDIFGAGGNITDPAGITVVGGWETHNGSTVTVKGTQCPLSNSSAPITATQPAGCPVTGQAVLPDPLAPKLTTSPALGTPACTGGTVTQAQDYNPAVTLNTGAGGLTAAATSVPVKWASGTDPISVNDVILVDSEQMRVTAITPGSGPGGNLKATLTVTRAYNSTTAATHANGAAVSIPVTGASGSAAVPAPCVYTSGSVTLHPGTYYGGICIGSLSASGCDSGNCSTSGTTAAYNPAVALSTTGTAYSPAVTLNTGPGGLTAAATSVPVKWTSGSDPIAVNDVILVGTEQMRVTAITPVSGTTATLTVTRGFNGTTAATHANGSAVTKATAGATGGAITASATTVPISWASGGDPVAVNDIILVDSEEMRVTAITAVTATSAALTVTRGYNSTTAATHNNGAAVSKYTLPSHVDATMEDGTYIIAGGGLRVCGASTLSAPHVLIYNTQDPSHTSGYGALDQFELNTTGSVNIGPPADGAYQGLTYWQDSALALDSADSCNSRNNTSSPSQTQINEYDIALMSAASTGANGSLGSISGSIYAPANRADFVEALSGTANLAVLSSCIMINGGNSTFAFNPTGLFGSNWVLGPLAG